MTAISQHFLVDNGDMTLIQLESGRQVLIDINIRTTDGSIPDVLQQLRDTLERDSEGRLFVDVMLLTHPDFDHCRGFEEHFHLGPIEEWSESNDKIVIYEMWSSPMVFKRASKKLTLCEDAKAWAKEARRRVAVYRKHEKFSSGDRIQILGEDSDGKTDDLEAILVKTDETITTINGSNDSTFNALLLAPLQSADEDDDDSLSKNNSSVILQFSMQCENVVDAGKYLMGGDAEVIIWERLWEKHSGNVSVLEYDVLLAPHHCSWHSLSHDSWSALKEEVVASNSARLALSQALAGARIISSSKTIKDDDNDPPCIRAKREYVEIVEDSEVDGEFRCLADEPGNGPFKIEVTANGPRPKSIGGAALGGSTVSIGEEPIPHG